ncbi:MAG: hypothetical protein DRI48_10585, partial [Chloroflexi bacterium]
MQLGNGAAKPNSAGGTDALNRPVQRTIQGVGTLYFAYDLAGRRTMLQDPKGGVVYYSYDQRGLVTRVDSAAGSTYYTHDARGALLSRRLPNGTCTYHTYDDAGRISKLENRKSDGTALSTFAFTRDANGNILTSLREDGSCWYYEYDGLQRLHKAEWKNAGGSTLYAFTYNYDKVGNRTSLLADGQVTCYSCNAANELVEEDCDGQTVYYGYDGRGNCIRRTVAGGHTTYFAYNSRNLLTAITSTDPAFTPNTFEYNALGQRIKKVDSTGTTRYVWDGLNIVLELDEAGDLKRRYTHGHAAIEGVASLLDVEDAGGSHYFYHFDQVGGVRQLTDAYQNTAQAFEYEPFGRILAETGSAPNDFTFPATYLQLPDLPTLRLSPTRVYDARLGRYTGRDLLHPATNRYTYAFQNSLLRVDPDAFEPQQFDWRTGQPIDPRTGKPRPWPGLSPAPNPHYDPRRPAPAGKPQGLGPAASSGPLYSCNCGWIDWGHALPTGPADLWEQILGETGKASLRTDDVFKVAYGQQSLKRIPILGLWVGVQHYGLFWVSKGLSEKQKKTVALAIFRLISEGHEALQQKLGSSSGFSEEDLPSNAIAFY